MRTVAMLLAALLQVSRPADAIVLSFSAGAGPVSLFQPLSLVVTLTNATDAPRYVHTDIGRHLEFAVRRRSDRTLLRGFDDPPGVPPMPERAAEWRRIAARQSVRGLVVMPLVDLGIERAGVFAVAGFWHGVSQTAPTHEERLLDVDFSHAETITLTVTGNVPRDRAGLRPPPSTNAYRPTCTPIDDPR